MYKRQDVSNGSLEIVASTDGQFPRASVPTAVLDGQSSITSTFWLRTSKTGPQGIVSAAHGSLTNGYTILFPNDDTLNIFENNSTIASFALPESIADNQYHHFAVTRDTTEAEVSLYLDGELVGTVTSSQTGTLSADYIALGQDQDDTAPNTACLLYTSPSPRD